MNVGLNFLWRLDLNDQVDVGNVQASRGDISSDQHFEFSFFESLHSNLALVLRNVSVHDLDVLLDFVSQNESVRVSLGLSEHDGLALTAVANQHVSQRRETILVGARDGKMTHQLGGLVLQVQSQIDDASVGLHVVVGDGADPPRDSR